MSGTSSQVPDAAGVIAPRRRRSVWARSVPYWLILPVAIAMLRTGAKWPTVAFLGWFGPRGLASIVFAVIVVEEADLPHTGTILLVTYVTVGSSVLLHGLSAAPLADRYAHWHRANPEPRESVAAAPQRGRNPVV